MFRSWKRFKIGKDRETGDVPGRRQSAFRGQMCIRDRFISTMANMLVIFGLVTYSTKGVSFGAIESSIPGMIIPKINGFPTIILWAVAAIIVVWFIWNKTTFGKKMCIRDRWKIVWTFVQLGYIMDTDSVGHAQTDLVNIFRRNVL